MLIKIAYRLRGLWVRGRILLAGGGCGPGLRVEAGFRLRYGFHPGFRFGRDIYLGPSTIIDCPPGARLVIGSRCTFTAGAFLGMAGALTIGDDLLMGEYSSIREADHGMAIGMPMRTQPMASHPIAIGNDVWLGRGCAVLAGSVIADGAVVAANSVLKGSVGPLEVVGGAPARLLKRRSEMFSPDAPGARGHSSP